LMATYTCHVSLIHRSLELLESDYTAAEYPY
jgi:hypothetical protein